MNTRTILVADDETHILNVVSIKLSTAGYKVLTAEDGAEALNLAQSASPDLVITDQQMPLLSGTELCGRLLAEPGTRDIPVILLTARGFGITDQDMRLPNVRRVVHKPFSPREILKTVQELLQDVHV